MDEKLIGRINELARKSKTIGLSKEEEAERARLRKEYLAEFRKGMEQNIMSNLYIIDENGEKHKVEKKRLY